MIVPKLMKDGEMDGKMVVVGDAVFYRTRVRIYISVWLKCIFWPKPEVQLVPLLAGTFTERYGQGPMYLK